jgi:predicted DNA-binding transcriptional regulator YafY
MWQAADVSETTSRVLRLLGLLQSRRVWSGEELAERLGVTTRSVRRDVERLRDLGYPVHASRGHGGGYQLGAGAALPPLLLDPEEAVAVAVCLRLAAGGSIAGVGESALRALGKLDQVMPARLRSQVSAVHEATTTLGPNQPDQPVAPDVLMTLARACRDHEHVNTGYTDRAGNRSRRRLEPYQLVTTGRRWAAPSPHARRPTRPSSCGIRSAHRRTATSRGSGSARPNAWCPNTFRRPR